MGKNTAAADSKTGKQIQQKMNQLINLKRCYVISSGQGGAMAHVCLHAAPPVAHTSVRASPCFLAESPYDHTLTRNTHRKEFHIVVCRWNEHVTYEIF